MEDDGNRFDDMEKHFSAAMVAGMVTMVTAGFLSGPIGHRCRGIRRQLARYCAGHVHSRR